MPNMRRPKTSGGYCIGTPDLIADLDGIETASAAWRASYAEPLIASVAPNAPSVITGDAAERGKAEFDHLRALFDNENVRPGRRADACRDELNQVDDWRDRVLIAMVMAFCAHGDTAGTADSLRGHHSAASAGRGMPTNHPGQLRRSHHAPAASERHSRHRDRRGKHAAAASWRSWKRRSRPEPQLDEQAVELRRSNAELEQFAYVASHDLQEPLRKVASFCQLLEKRYGDKLDERGIEYIGFAVDGAKRMQVLINDLLSFSRVGRLGVMHDEADLETALDDALANLAAAIEESNAEIVRPEQRLPRVVGDPTLLTMLWQNLIGNAVKFQRDNHPPRIVIECKQGTAEWLLAVTDNGIGIGEEFVDKVFVIFQRLHGRDEYSGTGLGLALCKKIVEHHGGNIRIDTSYADGTRFEFTLPAGQIRRVHRRGGKPLGHLGRSTRMIAATRPIDILLVEDDPGDELITREAFEHNKLQNRLHVAHDGRKG